MFGEHKIRPVIIEPIGDKNIYIRFDFHASVYFYILKLFEYFILRRWKLALLIYVFPCWSNKTFSSRNV